MAVSSKILKSFLELWKIPDVQAQGLLINLRFKPCSMYVQSPRYFAVILTYKQMGNYVTKSKAHISLFIKQRN